ncbi:hypothetical protein BDZ89DRAFT_1042846 [Hymenopellis radicata]|nr:hypothetical protein BDZ89DRAFT_1042846 [Hymenopellis radicata]
MASASVLSVLFPQFLGIILNWGLFGALTVQVLYGVFILDTVQSVFFTHIVYYMLVGHWGDLNVMIHRPWSGLTLPILNGILAATVQIFYAWRIWVLTKKSRLGWTLGTIIVVVALIQSIAAIVVDVRFSTEHDVSSRWLPKIFATCVVWLGGSLLCDVIITASMFYVLSTARAKDNFYRTNTLLTRLIYMTIQTGLLTSFIASAELVLLVAWRDKEFHEAPYSNALLVTLNARSMHHRGSDELSSGTLRSTTDFVATPSLSTLAPIKFRRPNGRELELQHMDIGTSRRGTTSSSQNSEGNVKPPYWGVQVSEEVIVQ